MTEIGEIPEEWVTRKFHEILATVKGKPPNTLLDYDESEKLLPYLSAEYLRGHYEKAKYCFIEYEKRITTVDEDDIIVIWDGSAGEFLLGMKGVLSSTMAKVIFKKGRISREFIYYFLKGCEGILKNTTKGSTIPHIDGNTLSNLDILLPTLQEQQKIAKILSNTDSLIESLDKLISKKRNIKQGLMQTLLTRGIGHTKFKMTEIGEIPEEWGTAKASDIYYIVTGTTPSTAAKEYWDQGKIEWFTPKDLRYVGASFSIFTSERKITEKAMTENSLTLLPLNSIVLSTRAPVGYVGINTKEATFNQGCKGLVPKQPEIVDTRFHAFYISRISNLLNTLSGGSTFKELSKETLGNITLPLPENGEQQKIAKILSDADKEIEVLEQKRYKYEMLKTGMMQQLLTGRIRVK